MKLRTILTIGFLSSFLTSEAQQDIPFTDPRWIVQAQGSLKEAYRGFNSLYLQNGIAFLSDEEFSDGVIEFDTYLSPRASFSGLIFRIKDPSNYEEIYLRSHQSGFPDAFQYTPVFNNVPAWQLYHDAHDAVNDGFVHWKKRNKLMGYNTVLHYPFDRWLHVKLLISGKSAELYLDHSPEPVAFIHELLMDQKKGSIGVKSSAGAVWFANFSYTKTASIKFLTKAEDVEVVTPPGTIRSLQVSEAFKEEKTRDMDQLNIDWIAGLKWKTLETEPSGLANFARLAPVSDSNTVFARFMVRSDRDQLKRLDIGYSDRIKIYFNGLALYSGNSTYRSRDYRYLGTIGYFEAVYIPLKKGDNTIMMAVSETFGGWGLMAKWGNMEGLKK